MASTVQCTGKKKHIKKRYTKQTCSFSALHRLTLSYLSWLDTWASPCSPPAAGPGSGARQAGSGQWPLSAGQAATLTTLFHRLIILIDQQSTLFLLLGGPTSSLSEQWGDFLDWRKFVQSMKYCLDFMFFKKSWNLSFFMKFVHIIK